MKRYLLYALGEIILITLGIFLAIQLNNWNEDRKENKEEHTALINLKQDFQYNLEALEKLQKLTQKTLDDCLVVLAQTGDKYDPSSKFDLNLYLGSVALTEQYYPRNGFLDDLIHSGKLDIIKNGQLRNQLSSWQAILNYLKKREDVSSRHTMSTLAYLLKKGNWLNVDEQMPMGGLTFPKSGFQTNNNDLLQQLEFENHVENHLVYLSNVMNHQNRVKTSCQEILDLIKKELK